MAKLYFTYGTMGSAKTLELLIKAYNFEENGLSFLILKPSVDTRDGDGIIKSRVGLSRECVTVYPDVDILGAVEKYKGILHSQGKKLSWVLVDESQFFTEVQIDALSDVVDKLDINVLCYGLRTDFQGKLFPGSKRLFELADNISEIKATCRCGKKTIINARVDSNGDLVTEGEQVKVGSNNEYVAMCRSCWKDRLEHGSDDNF